MAPSRWSEHVLTLLSAAKFVLQTDPENWIKDAASQIAANLIQPVSNRSSPVGSHESNGSIEKYFRALHGQIRAIRQSDESRAAFGLVSNSTVRSCVVRHASGLLLRFQTRNGQTPYVREQGHEYSQRVCLFGERVWARKPRVPLGRKWKAKWYDAHKLRRDE